MDVYEVTRMENQLKRVENIKKRVRLNLVSQFRCKRTQYATKSCRGRDRNGKDRTTPKPCILSIKIYRAHTLVHCTQNTFFNICSH